VGEKERIIKPLYAIRFILFTLIFVHHCSSWVRIEWLAQPRLAVAGFIIISGFLNGYLYNNQYDRITFKNIIEFLIKRLKKTWPLHLVMLLLTIALTNLFNSEAHSLTEFFKQFISNVLLLQSWINDKSYYFSFNGASWFLSTYMFLTIATVPILYCIKKLRKFKHSNIILIAIVITLYIILIVITHHVQLNNLNSQFWIYVFPPTRLLEYAIGILIGSAISKINFDFKIKLETLLFTILEIISLALVFIVAKFLPSNDWLNDCGSKWTIPIIFVVSIFSFQKGYISKFFSLNFFMKLGSSTMCMFLIHQVIISYMTKIVGVPTHYRFFALYMFLITVLLGIIITNLQHAKK